MFIKTLFIIPRKWISLTDEWIKKLWYIYTMKYYSAIKRNTFELVPIRWMNLEPIIQCELVIKRKTNTVY